MTIDGIEAVDPTRAKAQLLYGAWVGDASGKIDETKPPASMFALHQGTLVLGRSSGCDPHDFPLPATPFAWIGISAIDEAGNLSAMKKMRVDLKAGGAP